MRKVRIWVNKEFHNKLKGEASYNGMNVLKFTKKLAGESYIIPTQNETKKKKPIFKFSI